MRSVGSRHGSRDSNSGRNSSSSRRGSGFRRRGSRGSSTGLGFGVDAGDQFTGNDRLAITLDDLDQHTGTRRRHFEDDLVGLDVDQDFVAADSLAAATGMTAGCPVLAGGGTVEVYEVLEIM